MQQLLNLHQPARPGPLGSPIVLVSSFYLTHVHRLLSSSCIIYHALAYLFIHAFIHSKRVSTPNTPSLPASTPSSTKIWGTLSSDNLRAFPSAGKSRALSSDILDTSSISTSLLRILHVCALKSAPRSCGHALCANMSKHGGGGYVWVIWLV